MNREAVVAGMFYPKSKIQAAHEAALLTSPANGAEQCKISPLMIMLPHAGWVYSGGVAGMVISRVMLPQDLIILAPCHRVRGKGFGVWDKGDWNTPLGSIPVNERLAAEIIAAEGGFQSDYAPHEQDHAIEVLLPLLKFARHDMNIVPIAISNHNLERLMCAGDALTRVISAWESAGREMPLIVVSSDMSHFISDSKAKMQDAKALEAMVRVDAKGLYNVVAENDISMCGVLPAVLALFACRALGASKGELISYSTSGQVSGDMNNVVGYAGVMI